ncbi:MAG: ribbon-helix-helix domain-containing protein [Vampirovibrionales bacterium]|nr:ribbon-helix-helix domain-containing protein [Vampirovibrionales bacterium]
MSKEKKSIRVLISLPEKFLEEIDELAGEEHRTRSELIREALRNYIRQLEAAAGRAASQIL